MGFFSWNTCDGGNSIVNRYSTRETHPVWMIAPDGRAYYEPDYEGYGEFGGKDFYTLLSEINGFERNRNTGIDLAFRENGSGDNTPGVIYPKFVEELEEDVIAQYKRLPNPEGCEMQGYFYGGDFDEEEEEE